MSFKLAGRAPVLSAHLQKHCCHLDVWCKAWFCTTLLAILAKVVAR